VEVAGRQGNQAEGTFGDCGSRKLHLDLRAEKCGEMIAVNDLGESRREPFRIARRLWDSMMNSSNNGFTNGEKIC
jgi:hypothetical protein